MSNPIVNLNVRANTARAMADFKKFSDSLNNKFLVSGLKVDLITSTLRQINNEFQKSMGEQGLLGASSILAAQNQAALLTSTFKNFGLEASKSINANMTKALSDVAVRAGGTMSDIRKTMSAVPWMSTSLSNEQRVDMAKQMLSWQRGLRRAGVSENFGDLGQKFLSMKTNVGDMMSSGDPLASTIGMTMAKHGAQMGTIFNAEERTRILREVMQDPELNRFIQKQARETFGFRTYVEDLNTKLFNPESGLFGALRKVKMSATRTTTVFQETDKIIGLIFGPDGLFLKFFKRIGQTFKISDPLKFIVIGMDFLDAQIKSLSNFIDSPKFQQITTYVKGIFDRTFNVFKGIYDQIIGGNFDSAQITKDLKGSGTAVRDFIRNIGSTIRGENIDKQADFGTSIISTLVEETGKTMVTLIQEIFKVFIDKAPGIAAKALPAMSKAFNNIMTQMFGGLAGPIKLLMNFLPGPLGMISRTANATSMVGAGNPWSLAAVGAAAFAPSLLGFAGKGVGGLLGGGRGFVGGVRSLREAEGRRRTFGNRGYLYRRLLRGDRNRWDIDEDNDFWGDNWRGGPRGGGGSSGGGGLGFGEALESAREGLGSLKERFSRRGRGSRRWARRKDLTHYTHPIGPLPDVGYGNGIPWADDLYRGYNSKRKKLPILGEMDEQGNYEGNVSALSLTEKYRMQRQERIDRIGELREIVEQRKAERINRIGKLRNMGEREKGLRRGINTVGRWIVKNPIKSTAISAGAQLAGIAAWNLLKPPEAGATTLDEMSQYGDMTKPKGIGERMGISKANIKSMASGGAGIMNVLGGAAGGAQAGAIFGPWGIAIGAVLGAGVSLLDKGTRDGIAKFISGFGNMIGDWIAGMGNAFSRSVSNIWSGITGALANFVNMIKTGFENLPIVALFRSISGMGNKDQGQASNPIDWIKEKLGIHYQGLNDSGTSMAMEARMSGNRAFMTGGGNVANNGEIIIPQGGIGRLAEALGAQASMSNRGGQSFGAEISLSININNPVMMGNNKELIESLREPVLGIVNDAYKKINNNKVRNLYIS